MRSVGIREFKAHLSQVLRQVQEDGEAIEVTNRGVAVAHVVPVYRAQRPDHDTNSTWMELNRLITDISARWLEGVTAQDAINDVRRDL